MFARIGLLAVFAFASVAVGGDGERSLTVTTSRALPKIETVVVYKAGDVKPGKERPKPLLSSSTFGEPIALPGNGPYDVYIKPKGQTEVLAAGNLAVKPGEPVELKLVEKLGAVQVFQNDNSPRLGKIVLTAQDDPGPDEKGHVAVQVGTEYREELVVPEGFYAVWLVPGNGARAQRIADRIRVLAGRTVRVGD
ncbi:MAG TPA: hypothetical protein VKE74_32060 [Gemmataceae bacterium]|nr:hypothetical protein [Gemmataceae bacterium]